MICHNLLRVGHKFLICLHKSQLLWPIFCGFQTNLSRVYPLDDFKINKWLEKWRCLSLIWLITAYLRRNRSCIFHPEPNRIFYVILNNFWSLEVVVVAIAVIKGCCHTKHCLRNPYTNLTSIILNYRNLRCLKPFHSYSIPLIRHNLSLFKFYPQGALPNIEIHNI